MFGLIGYRVEKTVDTIGATATITASVIAITGTYPSVGFEQNEAQLLQ